MLSARSLFRQIHANDETYRLFCSIAASGEAQGGWADIQPRHRTACAEEIRSLRRIFDGDPRLGPALRVIPLTRTTTLPTATRSSCASRRLATPS
jgi:hypothetical protein